LPKEIHLKEVSFGATITNEILKFATALRGKKL